MEIVRTSQMTGKVHKMDLPITQDQINAYEGGILLQDAFPNLSADQREFFKSGITAEEWNAAFGEEDDDE